MKWIAFLAEIGLGGWEMIPKRDTKCNSAKCRQTSDGLFLSQKGYVRVCPVLIAGFCITHNTLVTRYTRAYYEHENQ